MIYEQIVTGGCLSYLVGCPDTCAAALIDPEASQADRYQALAAKHGLRIRYVIDTHTHADHFTGTRSLAEKLDAKVVMHRSSPAPFVDVRVDDGEQIVVGKLRLGVRYTPGHTSDSICITAGDRVFTGDTLLIGGTGRTDLPTGDPNQLYDSLFGILGKLDGNTKVCPGHDYKGNRESTIAREFADNPRLQAKDRKAFIELMNNLDLSMPTHMTEAIRTNMSGGKTIAELLAEAAAGVPFMSMEELQARVSAGGHDLVILDVRERDAYEKGHIPGARHLPRGQLELRVNQELPDPTRRILTCCELGRVSTLAASTLKSLGYRRVVALDGGLKAWQEKGYAVKTGSEP